MRNNKEIVKRVTDIRMEGSWERGRSKKKWIDVIMGDMKKCGISKEMVVDREMWREKIRK